MSVDAEHVRHIARLARLELSESEVAQYQRELSSILRYIDRLQAVDVTGIEPMTHVSADASATREDVPASRISRDEALEQSPSSSHTHFRVPRVVG